MLLLAAGFTVNMKTQKINGELEFSRIISVTLIINKLLPAAVMGVARFPFDMEGPNFATGALKVNPAYRHKQLNYYRFY